MIRWLRTRKLAQLERRLAETKAELEAVRRELRVCEAERDSLAAVVARDRERIRAEAATHAAQRAISEGNQQ